MYCALATLSYFLIEISIFLPFSAYASHDLFQPSKTQINSIPNRHAGVQGHAGPVLRAARLRSNLRRRSIQETLRHDHEFHYLDESVLGTTSQFGARLRMAAIKPTLALEEIDDHLEEIRCSDNEIELRFANVKTFQLAYKELDSIEQFLLITSHEGCNHDGERVAYLISKVSSTEDHLISLTAFQMSWEHAFRSLTVDFGRSSADFVVRRHNGLRKRQDKISPKASTTSFPIPPSSSPTPTRDSSRANIEFQYLDQAILPPDLPGPDELTLISPLLPQGFTTKCKNCTAQGTIDLIQGSFTMRETKSTSNDTFNLIEFLNDGYLELLVNDFSAHIELESSVQPAKTLKTYNAPMPEIGLPGFQIPGIAVVGPIFRPSIDIGVQVDSVLGFSYGFDLTVPNNASVLINMDEMGNSTVTGFQDTKISAIPFQADVEKISLSVSSSFSPTVMLGVSVFGGRGSAGIGVALHLPTVNTAVSQVTNVDSKCEPLKNSSASNGIIEDLFGSLTNLVPEVVFDLGLFVEAEGAFPDIGGTYTVLNKTLSLPTACLSFDKNEKSFVAATAAAASASIASVSASAAAAAASTTQTGDAAMASNPFAGYLKNWGDVRTTALILTSMFGCFMIL